VEDGDGQLGYGRYNVAGYSNDMGYLDILSHSSKSGKSGPTSPSEGKSGKSGGPSSGKSSKCKKFCTNRPTGSPTQVVSCSLLLSFYGGIPHSKKKYTSCALFEKMDPIVLYSLQTNSFDIFYLCLISLLYISHLWHITAHIQSQYFTLESADFEPYV